MACEIFREKESGPGEITSLGAVELICAYDFAKLVERDGLGRASFYARATLDASIFINNGGAILNLNGLDCTRIGARTAAGALIFIYLCCHGFLGILQLVYRLRL